MSAALELTRLANRHIVRAATSLFVSALTAACSHTSSHGNKPAEPGPGLAIDAPAARACDVVLDLVSSSQISFDEHVMGATFRHGGKVAVAFTSDRDSALPPSPVRFEWPAESRSQPVQIVSCACYDRLGRVVSNPDVRVTAE